VRIAAETALHKVRQEPAALVAVAAQKAARARSKERLESQPPPILRQEGHWMASVIIRTLAVDAELGGSPAALVDARFILELANAGGHIMRRQELPAAAFIEWDRLRRMPLAFDDSLRIICISHPWMQPGHPDPTAHTLLAIAPFLSKLLEHDHNGTYGIFWEYLRTASDLR